MKRAFAAALAALFLMPAALAQSEERYFVTGNNSTGVAGWGSYTGLRENVGLNNLNLNIRIPLFTLRGRGLDVSAQASYNATQREWVRHTTQGGIEFYILEQIVNVGSQLFDIQLAPSLRYVSGPFVEGSVQKFQNRYILRMPDGSRHEFFNYQPDGSVTQPIRDSLERMRAADGSSMELRELENSARAEILLKDGTALRFEGGPLLLYPQWIRGTNGNLVSFSGADTSTLTVTDTLGRTVVRDQSIDGATGDEIIEVSLLNAAGAELKWTLRRNPAAAFQSLTLPSGLQFSFDFADLAFNLENPAGQPVVCTHKLLERITNIVFPSQAICFVEPHRRAAAHSRLSRPEHFSRREDRPVGAARRRPKRHPIHRTREQEIRNKDKDKNLT